MTSTMLGALAILFLACACKQSLPTDEVPPDPLAGPREAMVRKQLAGRDITDKRVLEAMGKVPRHRFVPQHLRAEAYSDHPLPIGHAQTISQPYIVACMTQAAEPEAGDIALEIGTGSGYQAAILAEVVKEVYSIEIIPKLARQAEKLLSELGYNNIHTRTGDGYAGWPDKAPFDIILLTAAPPEVPQPLFDQLKEGGILVAPVGTGIQELVRYRKKEGRLEREHIFGVRFVPMTGRAQDRVNITD